MSKMMTIESMVKTKTWLDIIDDSYQLSDFEKFELNTIIDMAKLKA